MEKQHDKKQIDKKVTPLSAFRNYYKGLENHPNSPYKEAINGLKQLQTTAKDKDEVLKFLTQDIINTALSTTIMEELLTTLRLHHEVALPLIEKYCDSVEERDQLINIHTQNHVNFIINSGSCEGCASCEGHEDIVPLMGPWTRKDVDFFKRLYVEVQAIYCSLERILYDYIPRNTESLKQIDQETLNELREFIAQDVKTRIHTV